MNINPTQQQIIYQHEPSTVESIKSIRERMHAVGKKHMNRSARVQTIDGNTFDGTIVNIAGGFLYLSVPQNRQDYRQFNPYHAYQYNNVILPLVLYELLVISLL